MVSYDKVKLRNAALIFRDHKCQLSSGKLYLKNIFLIRKLTSLP